MKRCPFCAEQIQDNAIKCKHCNETVVQAPPPKRSKAPLILAILTSAVFSIPFFWLAQQSVEKADSTHGAIQASFGVGFIIAGVIAWFVGDAFRRFAMPSMVFASGAVEMAGQKLFWLFGPQIVCVFLTFCGAFYLTGEISSTGKNEIKNIAEGSQLKREAVSEDNKVAPAPIVKVAEHASSDELASSPNVRADDTSQANTAPVANIEQQTVVSESTAEQKAMPSPSFDCVKASTRIEKLICSSNDVAIADARLAAIYKSKLAVAVDKSEFKQGQKHWISATRDSCTTTSCLLDAYTARIDVLSE
jgi:uncharacterized protein YecT (DUF1311 family)